MENLRCTVNSIRYQCGDSGYAVLSTRADGYPFPVTVVGILPEPRAGAVFSVEGSWENDPRYGRQFRAERFREELPATAAGIEKYLSSGVIKGIGPEMAKRIVKKFGKKTLDILDRKPDALLDVNGIGEGRLENIKAGWEEQKSIRDVMVFLYDHGVAPALAAKIYKKYKDRSIQTIKENPYCLADDIQGVGFPTADRIAESLGIGKNDPVRVKSGLLYTLGEMSKEGHCFAARGQLMGRTSELLGVDGSCMEAMLLRLAAEKAVVRDGENIYLPHLHAAETGSADRLCRMLQNKQAIVKDPEKAMEAALSAGVPYDDIQEEAVRTALSSRVMVLTGGPGTGKTTTVKGIIRAYRSARCRILLAAPTGRAAKRLSETTGMEAETIHRLLEYSPKGGFQRDWKHPLKGDVIIVDECSMVDIQLFYSLLKAVPKSMSLILVGDADQLPSVGAGNVLNDIIRSGAVPVVRLSRIFRQAQGSRIIMNAHRINKGEPIDAGGGKDSDFFFSPQGTDGTVVDTLVKFCTESLPRYYHADMFRDIQVLSPMRKGLCGTVNLNLVLQEAMNPSGPCLKKGGTTFRLGDKVMHIKNNYDKGVFNGDVGIICDVNEEDRELEVDYDGRRVPYDTDDMDELVLAYATTIHKSQGSEYPIVVMPLTMGHYVMLQRNLLYTGVTRAKQIIVLIGDRRAVARAIRNETTTARNTLLAERITQEMAGDAGAELRPGA